MMESAQAYLTMLNSISMTLGLFQLIEMRSSVPIFEVYSISPVFRFAYVFWLRCFLTSLD